MQQQPTLRVSETGTMFLYEYFPWRSSRRNETTNLILDFKKDYPYAVEKVKEDMIQAFDQVAILLKERWLCRYIVAIPSSRAGTRNEPCEQVCEALASAFPWLTYMEGALERVSSVQKSSRSEPGMRPNYTTHFNSIRFTEKIDARGKTLIMLDDVITRGETSKACRDILLSATRCRSVLGLFVGKTVS